MINKTKISNELLFRREKLTQLRQNGNAYPNDFRRNFISKQLHIHYDKKNNKELDALNIQVSVAGRMVTRRIMGKVSFVTLQDMGGVIQLYLVQNELPKGIYQEHFKKWDIGDILGACGKIFKTLTGELSIRCSEIRLLTKSIRSFPDKFHGLVDHEIRHRQRYLDLITNHNSRQTFKIRSRILMEIRFFLTERCFIEVETPIMQNIPGGAAARPFVTHHNAKNIDLYLRVSPELYLKRLVVGGFERVFEINKNFRNEGLSFCHNPEFTMLELYMAYADYLDLIILVEELFCFLVRKILGTNTIQYGNEIFNFVKPFAQMTMKEAICHYCSKVNLNDINNIFTAITIAESQGIQVDNTWGLGRIQTEIFEKTVKNHLIQPTFITSYPTEVSPLARCNDKNSFFADRFELFINGYEICNGFSELNDSEEQEKRFKEQIQHKKSKSNNKNIDYDKEYITALEYGLPPTAGLGIGIDRLIMLFTNNKFISDVILFPILRSQK